MQTKGRILGPHARMWRREVFYRGDVFSDIKLFEKSGVYILYRDDVPYYVGQAKRLRDRLYCHACHPNDLYFNHWNYFSVFAVEDAKYRNEIESLLIAAMPTANSKKPLKAERLPKQATTVIMGIERARANPALD